MGPSRFLCLLCCCVAVLPLYSETEPESTGHQEHVSVTASRTPVPVDETGNSVTILTRAEIEERGATFLSELLRGIPGLSISVSGPAGTLTEVRVRGAEANHLQVRIDGVDVSDTFGADAIPLELLVADSIERIEFVAGPQSGLWGSEALAGVLDITTRRAETNGPSAEIQSGSFGTVRGGGRIGFGDERLHVGAGVSFLTTAGSNISRQGNEDDGAANTTASARLNWTPENNRFALDIVARHTDANNDFDDVDFVTTGLPIDADNRTDTTLTTVRAKGDWTSAESRWTHRLSLASAASDTSTSVGGAPSDTATTIDKIALSAQSTVKLGTDPTHGQQRLTLAVDHEIRDFSQRGPVSGSFDPNQDQSMNNTGVAVEYRFQSGNRWSTSAALRHESNSDFADITTYRVTASRMQGKTRLRAAAGSGQKAPTFIDRFGFFPGTFVGNPILKPERSFGFEVGVDREIGAAMQFTATYFNDTLENEINGFAFDPMAAAFTAVNESGESDRQGLELTLNAALGVRVDLDLGYTFTDATDPGDSQELRRPRQMASISAAWRDANGRVRIRGALHHTGSQRDIFFPPFPQPAQTVQLDGYLLAELTAAIRVARRVELVARGENLLDERYENVYGFQGSGIGLYVGLRLVRGLH